MEIKQQTVTSETMESAQLNPGRQQTRYTVIMMTLAVLEKCITKAHCCHGLARYAHGLIEQILDGLVLSETHTPEKHEVERWAKDVFKELNDTFGLALEILILIQDPEVEQTFVQKVRRYFAEPFLVSRQKLSPKSCLQRILSRICSGISKCFTGMFNKCRKNFKRKKQMLSF